jgi:hypothetical protein
LLLSLTGRQQHANLAALDRVNASDRRALLNSVAPLGERLNQLDPAKRLQQIGTHPGRHGLRRHNATPSCLSLSYNTWNPHTVILWRL